MSEPAALIVRYSCTKCGLKKVQVAVPFRGEKEGVVEWVQGITLILQKDHGSRSPVCDTNMLDEVWIPIDNPSTARIGAPLSYPQEKPSGSNEGAVE